MVSSSAAVGRSSGRSDTQRLKRSTTWNKESGGSSTVQLSCVAAQAHCVHVSSAAGASQCSRCITVQQALLCSAAGALRSSERSAAGCAVQQAHDGPLHSPPGGSPGAPPAAASLHAPAHRLQRTSSKGGSLASFSLRRYAGPGVAAGIAHAAHQEALGAAACKLTLCSCPGAPCCLCHSSAQPLFSTRLCRPPR